MKSGESLSLKKRAKQTLALFLSGLMVLGVLSLPINVNATDYSVAATPPIGIEPGTMYAGGDTLYVGNNASNPGSVYYSYRVNYALYESGDVFYEDIISENDSKPFYGVAVGDEGVYYVDGTFHFSNVVPNNEDTPESIKTMAQNYLSLYSYQGASSRKEAYYGDDERNISAYDLYFNLYYGFRVAFEGMEGDEATQYAYYRFGPGFVLDDYPAVTPEAGPVSEGFGSLIGWSNSRNYIDSTSDGIFVELGEPVPMDGMQSYLDASKTLTMYPVFELTALADDAVTIELGDEYGNYPAAKASTLTPAITGLDGRTYTIQYYKQTYNEISGEYEYTYYSDTVPDVIGSYRIIVTAAATETQYDDDGNISKRGFIQQTFTKDITCTSSAQENVVFDCPDGIYVSQYTFDPADYITGLKEDPVIHYQLYDTKTSDYMALDQVPDKAYDSMYIKISAESTEHYTAYQSAKEDFTVKVSWGPMPASRCTIEGERVTGETVEGMPVYKGPVTITAPEGYLFYRDYYYFRTDNDSFVDTMTFEDEGFNDLTGYFRRISDGAVTERTSLVSGMDSFWIDTEDPKTMNVKVDGTEADLAFGNNMTVTAKTLEFDVYDYVEIREIPDSDDYYYDYCDGLKSVTVDGVAVSFAEDNDEAVATVTLKNDLPGDKTFQVKAVDKAGHEVTWNITLQYPTDETPEPPYTISGTSGDADFYTTDVVVEPAEGYSFADDMTKDPSGFLTSMTFEETSEEITVRLYNKEKELFTEEITIPGFKIDKLDPVIASVGKDQDGAEVTITEGGLLHVKTVTFEVSDANLSMVTVNGDSIPVSSGKATITLSAESEEKEYEVSAKDLAGRVTTVTFKIEVYGIASGTVTAKTGLVYTGEEQSLVTPGTATNGSFVYCEEQEGDYLEAIPAGKDAGTYTVWYKVVGDEYYLDSEPAMLTITIAKADVVITGMSHPNLNYTGELQTLVSVTSVTGGTLSFKVDGEAAYSTEFPARKDAGTYTIQYKVDGDDNYNPVEGSFNVTIAKKLVGITWSNTEFEYDGEEHCPTAVLTDVFASDTCTFTVTGAAKEAGNHAATVTSLSNANYVLPENPSTAFVIKEPEKKEEPKKEEPKKAGTVTISMAGFYYGGTPTSPSIGSTTNDVSKASVLYRNAAGQYFTTVPTEVGTYTVSVTLPATGNYLECSASAGFTVSYLPVPDDAYTLEGTKGDGDWYTSYIEVVPGNGYEISLGSRDAFSTKPIRFEEGTAGGTIYIRKSSTGEQTGGVLISNLMIDATAPVINDLEKGSIYYADEEGKLLAYVTDKNIDKVVVDGKDVTVVAADGTNAFELPIGKKKQLVQITVSDKAGNKTTIDIITAPTWMKDGIVGEGEYYLEVGTGYKTSADGSMTLDGDSTVYSPNITFYAKREGDHTFHKH